MALQRGTVFKAFVCEMHCPLSTPIGCVPQVCVRVQIVLTTEAFKSSQEFLNMQRETMDAFERKLIFFHRRPYAPKVCPGSTIRASGET